MAAGRSKQDTDVLWELTKRLGGLETKVDELSLRARRSYRGRAYFLAAIKKLKVEKQGLRNYIKELETALKLPTGKEL